MLLLIFLRFLLHATAHDTADEPCVYEYSQFEADVITKNDMLHQMLEDAFYTPNKPFPYTVVARYQSTFSNGTRYTLSTDPMCREQIWSWNSAIVFAIAKPTNANIYSLYTLNYFRPLEAPHVDISVPRLCPNVTHKFLLRMTALVSYSALNCMYTYFLP